MRAGQTEEWQLDNFSAVRCGAEQGCKGLFQVTVIREFRPENKDHCRSFYGIPVYIQNDKTGQHLERYILIKLLQHITHLWSELQRMYCLNSLRPRQNGRHFPDDIFKWIFGSEIKISLKFVSKGLINHIPALVQIIAWHRPGDKPLSEPMMVSLLTYICVTRPQWVNGEITAEEHSDHRASINGVFSIFWQKWET